MLMLTRKRGEKIMIGPDIELVVTAVRGDRVQLGFAAPPGVQIFRKEIFLRMQTERAQGLPPRAVVAAPATAPIEMAT